VVPTILLYGIDNNLNYLDVLSYISRRGEAYYPNQSFNGLLNRLLGNGNNTDFEAAAFPPFNPIVYAGTIASSLVIVGAALFWRARDSVPGSAVDFALVSLSFTIASPIAWEHHYGVLMPMYALALPALIRYPVFGRWSLPVLAGSYVLASNFFNIAQKFAGHEVLTPVQSYLLFGALTLLVLLYFLRRAEAETPTAYGQPANSNAPAARESTIS
jgi:hypothetical protein